MGAVSSVIEAVGDAVSDVADFVTDEIIEPVVDTVSNVVENPAALAGIALSIAAPGLGTAIGASLGATGAAATAIGNAVIGGTLAEASGGDFTKGALSAGLGSVAGSVVAPELSSALGSQAAGQAATSGLLSEIQGGDFLSGAVSGGISGAVNDYKMVAVEDYLQSLPGGYEIDAAPAPTELDVLASMGGEYTAPDTSFTADYSLTGGTPTIEGMGGQGIQVPTINDIVDVVSQPVDYSLPAPDSGLGLVMPTTPNIDAMGGGQGITVPVSGGTLTESGVIPDTYVPVLGDETSFINQPAPDSGVTIPEVATPTADELLAKMSMADLVKTLGLTAASAYFADKFGSPSQDAITGFGVIPVPGEWTAPVQQQVNWQAPAPIDFGSRDLLIGTQWEKPLDLSGIVNMMNTQMPSYVPTYNAPTVGVNDVIGTLNGNPMSIADIVSGIQSGQTYTSTMG